MSKRLFGLTTALVGVLCLVGVTHARLTGQRHPVTPQEFEAMWSPLRGLARPDIVMMTLEAGADVRMRTSAGGDFLMLAARNGDVAAVRILLQRGAVVNAQDNERCTSLYYACFSGNLECLDLLLRHGADPNVRTRNGERVLSLAVKCHLPDMVTLLKRAGARP